METDTAKNPIAIAVDIMGGDKAPDAIIEGVGMALDTYGDAYKLLLVGDTKRIGDGLRRIGKENDPRLELVQASQVIEMGEHPISAIRRKRDASIVIAMDLIRDGHAQGLFSAGSTGAAVGAAYLRLRMMQGIERPGIAAIMPSEKGRFVIMDAGASVDCIPMHLLHFAIMGSIYAEHVLKIDKPRVGLMCNGTEEGKGNRATQDAFKLLSQVKGINFIGNVEGHDLFSGNVDVVVCDGFVGNVILKTSEQLAKSIGAMIKRAAKKSLVWTLGGLLMKGAFGELKRQTDYSETGGAPLLGVNGVVLIGHGISDAKATCHGIRAVGEAIRLGINNRIAEEVATYAELATPTAPFEEENTTP